MDIIKKSKKKVLLVFGTRPEAIKMCPLVNALKDCSKFTTTVCVTGQHREMLTSVLKAFNVEPDYDLAIMKENQTLFDITREILGKIDNILKSVSPDIVLVHGDTTTTFTVSLACFYNRIKVGHVEAGLRTYNIYSPFPEEFNRRAVSIISQYHFAPTDRARQNLLNEGCKESTVFVTGNTAIDALKTTVKIDYYHKELEWASDSKLILLTAHRRENLGEPMINMFSAVKNIIEEFKNIKIIYPVHMNPIIFETAKKVFQDNPRIHIIKPLDVLDFHNFLARCYLVLTDSGGIQEEAPSLGKPVLVMRDTTERPEGLSAGTLKLVGTAENTIYNEFRHLLTNSEEYERMSKASNPYGDGHACEKIVNILASEEI